MLLGVPQGVSGCAFGQAVTAFRAQDECLPAERTRLLVVAEKAVVPADGIERVGLGCFVTDGLVQAQRLLTFSWLNRGGRKNVMLS
jgi:hypothetical protein